MVGGAPGEDVATYVENCPRISFIGLNLYVDPETSVNEFRAALTDTESAATCRRLPKRTAVLTQSRHVSPTSLSGNSVLRF